MPWTKGNIKYEQQFGGSKYDIWFWFSATYKPLKVINSLPKTIELHKDH